MAATLLELSQQGDVATISDDSKLDRIQLLTPQQLYELWERQHWATQDLDFSRDRDDWAEPQRRGAGLVRVGHVGVLHRRGARDDPVLRSRDGL